MEAFTTHTGRAVPLRRSNVDTDQIIPAHWLKKVTRDGFEDGLFEAWRKDPDVRAQPARAYKGATVLVAGPDFGTGSSREHAVWALQNYGFKAVISLPLRRHLPRQLAEERPAHGRSSAADGRGRALGARPKPTRVPKSPSTWYGAKVLAAGHRPPTSSWTRTPAGGCSRARRHQPHPAERRGHRRLRGEASGLQAADPTGLIRAPTGPAPHARQPRDSCAPRHYGGGRSFVLRHAAGDNSPQMAQSVHGTRRPTRALRPASPPA